MLRDQSMQQPIGDDELSLGSQSYPKTKTERIAGLVVWVSGSSNFCLDEQKKPRGLPHVL
jgi:hypothetical protein